MRKVKQFALGTMTVGALLALGCESGPSHPDTKVGAGQTPPPTVNCADLCQRMVSCAVALCNEDTKSTQYTLLGDLLEAQCTATCSESLLQSKFTTTQWGCAFSSSCRAVFDAEYDVCNVDSYYRCM